MLDDTTFKTIIDSASRKLIDVSRLSNIGWKYNIDLEDGLKQTYKWYLTRGSE
jgi:nucleoside-diphosphate-sugar epimerase